MKNIYEAPEFKKFNEFNSDDLVKIDVKSTKIIQEISRKGKPVIEPRLLIDVTNGQQIKIDGYDRTINMFRTLTRMMEEKSLAFYQKVINLIQNYLAGVTVIYAGNERYIIKRKATGEHIEIAIPEKNLRAYFEAGMSDSMIVTQLMKSIYQEFWNKYGSSKRRFYFNGVYWSTEDADGHLKTMSVDEIDVMLNNSVSGQWDMTGIFETRNDVRTWTGEKTYEETLQEQAVIDTIGVEKYPINANSNTLIMGGMEFKSLLDEVYRTYEFPDGKIIKIYKPLWLNVSKSGGHRVLDEKGVSHYVPKGWIHLQWKVKDGCSPFAF